LSETVIMQITGVRVDQADSAQEALERIMATDYDVIITDIKMPNIDGLSLLHDIMTLRPETPTLVITGYGEQELAVRAVTQGAYAFLTKPMDPHYFVAWLRRALQSRQLTRRLTVQQHALVRHAAALEAELSQRLRAEEALRESECKFRSVIQSAHDAIVLVDGTGTILLWNLSAQVIFGYTEQEILGKLFSALIPSQGPLAHAGGLDFLQRDEQGSIIGRTIELQGLRKDGSEFPIELSFGS
jgi:PAS domain S-box-containing protein